MYQNSVRRYFSKNSFNSNLSTTQTSLSWYPWLQFWQSSNLKLREQEKGQLLLTFHYNNNNNSFESHVSNFIRVTIWWWCAIKKHLQVINLDAFSLIERFFFFHFTRPLCVPGILAFIALVSCSKLYMNFFYKTIHLTSMHVITHTGMYGTRASKWAQALNFWWITSLSSLDKVKGSKKISGSISLFLKVSIPGTHGTTLCKWRPLVSIFNLVLLTAPILQKNPVR